MNPLKPHPKLSNDPFERYIQFKNDPYLFITTCVRTKDQIDRAEPIKLFPDKDYLRLITRLWQRYPLMAVPKTRRMTMSWLTISLYTHELIFNKAIHTAFVSKKEDDANELVERAKFILDNLDYTLFPKELIPKYYKNYGLLVMEETDSRIQGFASGADQLRQFTLSGIFCDEMAFHEMAEKFYAATLPTIDGGGRMTLVSSPAPGFFKKLCFDAIDAPGEIQVAEYAPDFKVPMQGVRTWVNAKNRFMVVELHYTADESKRDPSYKESIKNSMPLQEYLREYELYWDTFEGQPVYPEFNKSYHITDEMFFPVLGLPMLIGFDFGLTPSAIIGQFVEGELRIFEEINETNMGIERFSDKVIEHIKLRYPTHSAVKEWLCTIDPSGDFRKDTDETTCAQILASKGFMPAPGPVAFEKRKNAVVHFLMRLNPTGPAFKIYSKGAPILIKGFEGGYHYPDKAVEIEPTKLRPLKNLYSHPHDALQYLCSRVQNLVLTTRKNIPRAGYSINMEKINARN